MGAEILNKNLEEKIRNTVKTQNKRAYLIAKALKAVSKNKRSRSDDLKNKSFPLLQSVDTL